MKNIFFVAILAMSVLSQSIWADGDLNTKFSNKDSVGNTRHNLTQNQLSGGGPISAYMAYSRNDYGEVCVYCHTPHGSNTTIAAPLWNRTLKASTTYTTYSSSTIEGVVTSPGANSLTCLSCHDGTVAVDSIINMPGSGNYLKGQETSQTNAFLSTWDTINNPSHLKLVTGSECLVCHTSPGIPGAPNFTVAAIGTDLSNDHPVGVPYRDPDITPGVEYNGGTVTRDNLKFFDTNGNGRADKNEVRFYNTGQGFEVECATCHDPHGVPSAGAGSAFNKTFMRKNNTGSSLCLTCHTK